MPIPPAILKALGSMGCLLLLLSAYAFVHYNLLCLLVPCDRSVDVTVQVTGPAAAAKCALQLFSEDGPIEKVPIRKSDIEYGRAGFILGPWANRYRARVACKGFKPTPLALLEMPEGKRTVDFGSVRLEPESPKN